MRDARSLDRRGVAGDPTADVGGACRSTQESSAAHPPSSSKRGGWYAHWGKRALDLSCGLCLLLLASPLLVMVGFLVRFFLGHPVLFRQQRPGLRGIPFTLLKFRTMTETRDGGGRLLPDAVRLTPFGRLLRATSLDELPELWNVVRGDMSLVGPRPLLMQYLPRYTPEQSRRHDVRPGLTGWAQVNGRNALSWEEKFELDVWYVDHLSCWLDLKIAVLTPWRLVSREGISAPGQATMAEFRGTEAASPMPPRDVR